VLTGRDLEARTDMLLAASFAGMGFGNAGVHLPHARAYPIAGRVPAYRPPDYPQAEPMVPHGESVSLTAPEAFRFTFPTDRSAIWQPRNCSTRAPVRSMTPGSDCRACSRR
jgi:hydroxyacid-oxoacid transhydrogenase